MVKITAARSKRQKTSLKYNNQKRVREHKRRLRKEAKRLGIKKRPKRDPGIPNNWPFKAQMLQEMEEKQERKEEDMEKRRQAAKDRTKQQMKEDKEGRKTVLQDRAAEKKDKRDKEIADIQRKSLHKIVTKADCVLVTLDARDPLGCRCAAIEAWAKESGKRLIFVVTKADLATPKVLAQWLQFLGQVGPAVAVSAEAGRDGVGDLLKLLGREPAAKSSASSALPTAAPAQAVGVIGFPGTGKKALMRAIRVEVKGPVEWLFETPTRFPTVPAPVPLDVASSLHLALRGDLPKHPEEGTMPEAVAIVGLLLERATAAPVMRRFRLPAFQGTEGLLAAFRKDKDLKTKKGKELGFEATAKRFLQSAPELPGCGCTPPEAQPQGSAGPSALWGAHAAARVLVEAIMKGQVDKLANRGAGVAAGQITLSSAGMGPKADFEAALAEPDEDEILAKLAAEGSDDSDDDDMEGSDMSDMGEEGGEEESDMEMSDEESGEE